MCLKVSQPGLKSDEIACHLFDPSRISMDLFGEGASLYTFKDR